MRLVTVFAALALAACSSEPTAAPTVFPPQPSGPVNVSGIWLTSWSGGGIGHSCTGNTTVTLTQAAGSGTFTGTYSNLVVTCDGWTGNSVPAWTPSDTVVSGQLVYDSNNNIEQAGPARWASKTSYAVGQKVMDSNNNIEQCTVAGTTAAKAPKWNKTVNGTTTDSTITWTNLGVDATGTTAPAWSTTVGGTTVDGSVTWTNTGPLAATASVGTVTGTVTGYNITMDLTNALGAGATIHQSGVNLGGPQLIGTSVWSNVSYQALGIVTPCGNTVLNASGCGSGLTVTADTTRMTTVTSNWVATH